MFTSRAYRGGLALVLTSADSDSSPLPPNGIQPARSCGYVQHPEARQGGNESAGMRRFCVSADVAR